MKQTIRRTGSVDKFTIAVALALLLSASVACLTLYAYEACVNTGASYTNAKSACMANCLTNIEPAPQSCAYSVADQLVYCDCNAGTYCKQTSVQPKNFLNTSYANGTCINGSCGNGGPPMVSTNNQGNVQQSVGCQ